MYPIFGAFAVLTVAAMRDFASEAQSYAVTCALRITRRHMQLKRIGYGFAAGAPPNGSGFSDRR